MAHQSGDVLGRYQLLCPIAAGGMATVWAARVLGAGTFQKPVALKLMLPHLARDERFVKMFMDEAMLAANIQSPHVVGTFDLGHDDDTLYMAMELVLGMTLRDLLLALQEARETDPSVRIPLDVALALLLSMARGLTDAHEARGPTGEPLEIIHRDVSPHNVLLGLDGRARLSDFGIARAVQRQARTETGEVKGKLSYFAPEQLRSEELDQRVDVFALGIVMWEVLAGRRLFEGENPLQLANQIATQPIPRIDEVRADVPTAVADAIARALVREREGRWQTARELADALGKAAPSPAPEMTIAAFFRQHAGPKVEALEKRVRERMALPMDAALDKFRSGPSTKVTFSAEERAAVAAAAAVLAPRASAPVALADPPVRPHYGRIAMVTFVVLALLGGTAWGATVVLGSDAPPSAAPVALAPPPTVLVPPASIATPPAPTTVPVTTTTELAAPPVSVAADDAPPDPSDRHEGRRGHGRGPTPPTSAPEPSVVAASTRPGPSSAHEAPPPPPPPPSTTTPTTSSTPRSIVAGQDEFCRAMGTCP